MKKNGLRKEQHAMKIDTLELCNYKGFKKIKFDFHGKLNLFVGVNGSGKSSILDSMALAFSWLVNRIQRERSNGSQIVESDLRNGSEKGYIDIHVTHETTDYRWFLTKSARGSKSAPASYDGATKLAEVIREEYHDAATLPVIAYYPTDRGVNRIIPNVPSRDSISDLDVYENALSGKSNFHSLFEWFRHQDDILNEQASSRSHWMKQHKLWISRRINKIMTTFEGLPSRDNIHFKDKIHNISKVIEDEFILEDPRMFFMELSHLTHRLEIKDFWKYEMMYAIDDLAYMFHKMALLSKEFQDELIEANDRFFHLIQSFLKTLMNFPEHQLQEGDVKRLLRFIWETFSFAVLISLWWMSDKGRKKVEMLLRQTRLLILRGQPFDYEDEFVDQLRNVIKADISSQKYIQRNEGKELRFVRKAIEAFIPEYKDLQVKRVPRPRMELTKNSETFDLNQLSDGEKNLIALIGDIARRLTMANPKMSNPLEGSGIILIDEVDLHLHPKWQRIVAQKLPKIFSKCQFFISTHSPQVISHVKPESIIILENKKGEIIHHSVRESFGKNSDRILEDIMDETSRPEDIDNEIKSIFKLIQDGEIEKAKKKIKNLRSEIGDDSELVKADVLIKRREIIGK
mgnify:CR=1 FL=1|tara:strand:- start:1401 stop:3287 length:1887 start_codon:yes stop_codon:yes gene_type:complete